MSHRPPLLWAALVGLRRGLMWLALGAAAGAVYMALVHGAGLFGREPPLAPWLFAAAGLALAERVAYALKLLLRDGARARGQGGRGWWDHPRVRENTGRPRRTAEELAAAGADNAAPPAETFAATAPAPPKPAARRKQRKRAGPENSPFLPPGCAIEAVEPAPPRAEPEPTKFEELAPTRAKRSRKAAPESQHVEPPEPPARAARPRRAARPGEPVATSDDIIATPERPWRERRPRNAEG